MNFEQRQQVRKFKREQRQKSNAKLMKKLGGYNSLKWRLYVDSIRAKIVKRLQLAQARKEARLSNQA